MHKYRLVAKKGEGTFSEVLKAQSIKNGKYVAIKCMKNHFDSLDQVNNLREIQALRRLSPHPGIIKLIEVLYDQPTGRLALVFELMDMNIYELIRGRRHYVAEDRIKHYMYQLMKSMDHMHRNGIFHRDIKPENILIMDDCLKLADFGSCRGIYSKQPYTEYISTRWYRAPECLLTDGYYNYKMDMWGVGCVFFEIVSLFPLFPGTNELDQIQKIHNILGTPPPELLAKMKKRSQHMDFNFPPKEGTGIPKLIPHASPECIDLICKLLAYNPDDRLSARQALKHPYFRELREADKRAKALMQQEAPVPGAPGEAGAGHSSGGALPDATSKSGASMTGSRRLMQSPNGSETEDGGAIASAALQQPTSPPEPTHRHSEGVTGLPSISKQPQATQGHHYDGDEGGDDSGLPPIGNLSLGKANMAANSIRRGALPTLAGKGAAAQGAAAGPAGNAAAKRQSVAPVAAGASKYGNKMGGASGAAQGQAGAKYNAGKGNAAAAGAGVSKGAGKYISPYSLRNLADQS